MTNKEIDAMQAGPQMDSLILNLLTGKEIEVWTDASAGPSHGDPGGYSVGVRPYSTDIETAWEIVEKLKVTHGFWMDGDDKGDAEYEVDFQHGMMGSQGFSKGNAKGTTAPLAICRAALKTTITADPKP